MVICLNMLLLLNLVIAIMADTWATLSEVKLGLYLKGIVEAIPTYKNDKRYGGLISMAPPFNTLALLLFPFYHCIKDEKKLASFNKFVCKLYYFPIALLFTGVFLAGSILMTPIAWIKVTGGSMKSCCSRGSKNGFCSAVFYIFLGLPYMILVTIVDSYWFLKHQYHQKH